MMRCVSTDDVKSRRYDVLLKLLEKLSTYRIIVIFKNSAMMCLTKVYSDKSMESRTPLTNFTGQIFY